MRTGRRTTACRTGPRRCRRRCRRPEGFSLIEMLIVIAILGIMTAMVLPRLDPLADDQLQAVAQVVAADLTYARDMAVTNQSNYSVAFSLTENAYTLSHTGSNSLFDALPPSPFRKPGDRPDQLVVSIAGLPQMASSVVLAAVVKLTPTAVSVADVEFGPYGQTTAPETTVVWLQLGSGESLRTVTISIDPITGLTEIGEVGKDALPAIQHY